MSAAGSGACPAGLSTGWLAACLHAQGGLAACGPPCIAALQAAHTHARHGWLDPLPGRLPPHPLPPLFLSPLLSPLPGPAVTTSSAAACAPPTPTLRRSAATCRSTPPTSLCESVLLLLCGRQQVFLPARLHARPPPCLLVRSPVGRVANPCLAPGSAWASACAYTTSAAAAQRLNGVRASAAPPAAACRSCWTRSTPRWGAVEGTGHAACMAGASLARARVQGACAPLALHSAAPPAPGAALEQLPASHHTLCRCQPR